MLPGKKPILTNLKNFMRKPLARFWMRKEPKDNECARNGKENIQ